METLSLNKVKSLALDCDAIFAVFDVRSVHSPRLWDILEGLAGKK